MPVATKIVYGMARSLMDKYGLCDWTIKFNRRASSLGLCDSSMKTIALSLLYMRHSETTEALMRNTILHEIAHALVGVHHGHDDVWKAKALEIGCDGNRCIAIDSSEVKKNTYAITCGCGTSHKDVLRKKFRNMIGKKCIRCDVEIKITKKVKK